MKLQIELSSTQLTLLRIFYAELQPYTSRINSPMEINYTAIHKLKWSEKLQKIGPGRVRGTCHRKGIRTLIIKQTNNIISEWKLYRHSCQCRRRLSCCFHGDIKQKRTFLYLNNKSSYCFLKKMRQEKNIHFTDLILLCDFFSPTYIGIESEFYLFYLYPDLKRRRGTTKQISEREGGGGGGDSCACYASVSRK